MSGTDEKEPLAEIIWAKKWDQPIHDPATCPHPTTEVLTINQRLEPTPRGQHRIAMDATICMCCGADKTNGLPLKESLRLCMEHHGWHRETGERLYDLVNYNAVALWNGGDSGALPIWFFYAWGWSGRQIGDALNAGQLEAA